MMPDEHINPDEQNPRAVGAPAIGAHAAPVEYPSVEAHGGAAAQGGVGAHGNAAVF